MANKDTKKVKTLSDMIDYYFRSPQYRSLRGRTQMDYEYCLNNALATKISESKTLGNIKLDRLGKADCKLAYQEWLTRGVRTANITATTLSVVLNMAEQMELLMINPMKAVKRMTQKPRQIMWTPDQVRTFLDTAYSDFKWRSIGLIVHMAYEFAQRVGDMRLLKWNNINFEARRLDLTQSKKRAEVHLPIEDNLYKMLEQQQEDFGFQKYVVPHVRPINGAYRPYTNIEVSPIVNEVKAVCGLPSELQAMDMRRTAITEMVEAGVDSTQIMAVSGHTNPNSMKPYLKHTFASANNALSRRGEYKHV